MKQKQTKLETNPQKTNKQNNQKQKQSKNRTLFQVL